MDRHWVPPTRLIGTDAVRVIVYEPDDELSAVGATREAIRAYTERRLGAEGARLLWERDEAADDPVLTLSFVLADLEEVGQAGYMVNFFLEMRRSLPVEPHSPYYTTPAVWSCCSMCYAPPGALANAFWPHFGGILDEFTAAWRNARYCRLGAPALPPVPERPEWLDDDEDRVLPELRREFERLLNSADAALADGPLAEGRREPRLSATDVDAVSDPATPPDPAIIYLPLPWDRPPHAVDSSEPNAAPQKPPSKERRPRYRRRGRPKV